MANTANSQWNKTVHDEDTLGEDNLRAQHEALSKMASMPAPLQPTATVPSVAPAPSVAPTPAAPAGPMQHPAFAGIVNHLKHQQKLAALPKIAPGLRQR